jgi:hypothetical protein
MRRADHGSGSQRLNPLALNARFAIKVAAALPAPGAQAGARHFQFRKRAADGSGHRGSRSVASAAEKAQLAWHRAAAAAEEPTAANRAFCEAEPNNKQPTRVPPNPSLERTATGKALGPRARQSSSVSRPKRLAGVRRSAQTLGLAVNPCAISSGFSQVWLRCRSVPTPHRRSSAASRERCTLSLTH